MTLAEAQRVWRACMRAAKGEYLEAVGKDMFFSPGDRQATVLVANKFFDALTERKGGGKGPVREVDLKLLED